MVVRGLIDRGPMQVFARSLHGGLAPGELGAVIGRAGVGKSALLVHLALDRVLRGERVLHVSLRDTVEHVRAFYDEIFRMVARAARLPGIPRMALELERERAIHVHPDGRHDAARLLRSLELLEEYQDFRPTVVLVDGSEPPGAEALDGLARVAGERGIAIWMAVRTHREEAGRLPEAGRYSTVVSLEPRDDHVELKALKVHGRVEEAPLGLRLDPTTLLVRAGGGRDPATGPRSIEPSDCTLYSGGAAGAEAAFGEMAERYGMSEVNFTFDGHDCVRTRGRYVLSPRELYEGDVSLLYVTRMLHRTYSDTQAIRPVLQSLWHQVYRARQVFVIGTIQEDGTVVGGTGWSVELARKWHKPVWVFDQRRGRWYVWSGTRWEPGTPRIEEEAFCGTGTRHLEPAGRQAIEDLFERSFGTP